MDNGIDVGAAGKEIIAAEKSVYGISGIHETPLALKFHAVYHEPPKNASEPVKPGP
jgi:hypothetical protein